MSFKSFSTGSKAEKSEKSDKPAAAPATAQPEKKPADDAGVKKS